MNSKHLAMISVAIFPIASAMGFYIIFGIAFDQNSGVGAFDELIFTTVVAFFVAFFFQWLSIRKSKQEKDLRPPPAIE